MYDATFLQTLLNWSFHCRLSSTCIPSILSPLIPCKSISSYFKFKFILPMLVRLCLVVINMTFVLSVFKSIPLDLHHKPKRESAACKLFCKSVLFDWISYIEVSSAYKSVPVTYPANSSGRSFINKRKRTRTKDRSLRNAAFYGHFHWFFSIYGNNLISLL